MIPKKIHYCWFGRGEKPKKAQKCIASWKKYCPDYEIIEWNEDNFDVYQNEYTKYTYENKKYAFLSDYARLVVVYNEGGIYLDTDVEIIKPLDDLLVNSAYFGFENDQYVATGLGFGAEKNHSIIETMIDEYNPLLDGKHDVIMCPQLNTNALVKFGLKRTGELQTINGIYVYPVDYFNPYDDPTGRLNITENTYSIHWFSKSWASKKTVIRSIISKPLHRWLGKNFFGKLRKKR